MKKQGKGTRRCPRCKGRHEGGFYLCLNCHCYMVERRRKHVALCKRLGRCVDCFGKADGRRCPLHYERHKGYDRASKERKRAVRGGL